LSGVHYGDGSNLTGITASGGGVTDHGALTGLVDDDHTQYALADGSRDISGAQIMGNNLTVTGTLSARGAVSLGVFDTDAVYLTLFADSNATGGRIAFHTGPAHDTPITDYRLQTWDDYFTIGPSNDFDMWKFDGANSLLTAAGNIIADAPTLSTHLATKGYVDDNSINNVVEDTTPQLGGNLDTNGNDILFGSDTISGTGDIYCNDLEVSGIMTVASGTAPSTSSGVGMPGNISWDADYVYVCVATDTWKRSALTTW